MPTAARPARTPRTPRDWLDALIEIADACDEIALRHFRSKRLRVETKPDRSPVTEADLAIEARAREMIAARAPGVTVLGEEHGAEPDRGAGRLVIDPIDSTANFARAIPIFATLLAIEQEGGVVASLVSAPALGTRWSAVRGGGAFRDGEPIQVSAVRDLALAQAFHGSLAGGEAPQVPPGHRALLLRTHRQRGFGDFYQHVLVAEGAGEIAIDPVTSPWDVGPLILIAEEAGGRATSLTGERSLFAGSLVTTNGRLHDEVLSQLRASPAPMADR